MREKITKSALLYLFLVTAFCLVPALSRAAFVVQTEIASGKIVQVNEDHSVKLDNGVIYHPSRKGLVINLPVGAPVTLRYVVETSNKNVFIEFAPGLNSLTPPPPDSIKKGAKPVRPK